MNTNHTPTLDPRTMELLDRITSTPGPIASSLSASEWHELSEELETFRYRSVERSRDPKPDKEASPAQEDAVRASLEARDAVREHKAEIDRLRDELKEARELLLAREGVLDRATESALDVEADVHALRIENERLRKMRDAMVAALEASRDGE